MELERAVREVESGGRRLKLVRIGPYTARQDYEGSAAWLGGSEGRAMLSTSTVPASQHKNIVGEAAHIRQIVDAPSC